MGLAGEDPPTSILWVYLLGQRKWSRALLETGRSRTRAVECTLSARLPPWRNNVDDADGDGDENKQRAAEILSPNENGTRNRERFG